MPPNEHNANAKDSTACQTWFYNSSKPAAEKTLQISSTNSETVLSSLPYRFSDEAPADEDISAFEFIKTYPLKQLVAADVAEDRIYRCKTEGCGTHLTRRFDIISKVRSRLFISLTRSLFILVHKEGEKTPLGV
jgi:hypothetical protein